jgi:hypothetical protein
MDKMEMKQCFHCANCGAQILITRVFMEDNANAIQSIDCPVCNEEIDYITGEV